MSYSVCRDVFYFGGFIFTMISDSFMGMNFVYTPSLSWMSSLLIVVIGFIWLLIDFMLNMRYSWVNLKSHFIGFGVNTITLIVLTIYLNFITGS